MRSYPRKGLVTFLGLVIIFVTPTASVRYNQIPVCPANESLSRLFKLEGAQFLRTCLVECTSSSKCVAVHRTNGVCYFANSTQFSEIFSQTAPQSSEPCVSHTKQVGNVASKLVVFFDFRQGFSNLISPGGFDASPRGAVVRDAQGAQFPGTAADYIEVDTQGGSLITNYLDQPNNFSFYAKVVRQTGYQAMYHYIYDCSSTAYAGRFGDRDGYAWVEHQFTGETDYAKKYETRQSQSFPFLKGSTMQPASLGAVFYGRTLNNFYLNGTDILTTTKLLWSYNNLPRCLRLGFSPDNFWTGRMVCYAIAKDALNNGEFQQLEQFCS